VLVALAAQACATATPAPAPLPPESHTFEEAVAFCRDHIKQTMWGFFDAFVPEKDAVEYGGTPEEQFEFRKCMSEHGHTLTFHGDKEP
jgi:hypothetical protein